MTLDLESALEAATESKNFEKAYSANDLGEIWIGCEMFRCPEVLFDPSILGSEEPGIHEILSQSVMKTDPDARIDLYSTIALAGGGTLFPG